MYSSHKTFKSIKCVNFVLQASKPTSIIHAILKFFGSTFDSNSMGKQTTTKHRKLNVYLEDKPDEKGLPNDFIKKWSLGRTSASSPASGLTEDKGHLDSLKGFFDSVLLQHLEERLEITLVRMTVNDL
ncbi:hypothetical protein Tco_0405487 [Tanacetum coccineum]